MATSFKEFIGNAFNWIKKAIKAVWHIFKVIVKQVIKLLSSFMRMIGDFVKSVLSEIRSGLKKIFVVKNRKSDFKTIIEEAEKANKIKKIPTSTDELFGDNLEESEYDYNIVITDNDFNPEKIETISAEELDKQIGRRFNDEVHEITIK